MKNEMHIRFKSWSQNEAFARVAVGAFASQMSPTLNDLADIKTAVSEAVTNAIIHGYENDYESMVDIDAYIDGNKLEIYVRDSGKGISDITQARQPFYTSKPEMDRSGMGFAVMEAFMDSVEVESESDCGTNIRMIKTIGKKQEAEQ